MESNIKTFINLSLATLFYFVMIALRIVHTGTNYYLFLIWNLFLAWIPYLLSLALTSKKSVWNPAILGVCILFLPNAPYIITDLFHLRLRSDVPYWFDTFLLFGFSITGLLLGAFAMLNIYRFLKTRFNNILTQFGIIALSIASAFGVYIGRYQRWNSWNLANKPKTLLIDCLHLLKHESFEIFSFCSIMGVIIYFSYFIIQQSYYSK
jgi:uncharacterized membrane protein